jgi:cardiolipin synthase
MNRRSQKSDIMTIPNLLSLIRLGLIPVYANLYLQAVVPAQYRVAGLLMSLSCLTDLADGWIARRFHMVSTLGKILDPLADKLTQLALTVLLSIQYPVLRPVMVLLLVKEIFQLILAVYYFRRGKMLPGALIAGKICTTVLFVSLISLVLVPEVTAPLVRVIALTDGLFLTISFVQYLMAYWGPHPMVQDFSCE